MFGYHDPAFSTGRRAICSATGAVLGLYALGASAATWPNKAIRIVAAQAPGSSNDVTARALADYFTQRLGVPAIVENRPGGVSMIAADAVAHSPADGHTLLIALNSQLAQAPVLLKKPPIDPDKDLIPVASIGVGPVTGVAHKDFPAQTLEELIAYAKKKPVNVGNYAIGSGWQLMLAQLTKQTGAQFNVVNYKGTGAMLMDLYAGQVDIGAGSLAGIGAGIQKGVIKPFVVFTPRRSRRMPEVPTWTESGFRGPAFEDLLESNVLYVPVNTPTHIVTQLAALVHDAYLESPRLKNALQVLAEDEPPLTGEDLRRFIDRSWVSYRKLTRQQGTPAE